MPSKSIVAPLYTSHPVPILKTPGSHKTPQTQRIVQFSPEVTQQQLLRSNDNLTYIPDTGKNQAQSETAVTDSGATNDMSGREELFEYIVPLKKRKYVTLGDDKTSLIIKGYGMMNYLLNGKRVRRFGYFVPELGVTLLSIKQHVKYQGCFFHAENDSVILAYPKAVLYVTTEPEFALKIAPARHLNTNYIFDEEKAIFTTRADKRQFKVVNKIKAKYITNKKNDKKKL